VWVDPAPQPLPRNTLQSDRVIGPMAGVELAIGQGCDAGD
jgi:hypothetical protein